MSADHKTLLAVVPTPSATIQLRWRGAVPIVRFDVVPRRPRRPPRPTWIKHAYPIYVEKKAAAEASAPGHELLLHEAIREGLDEEMERDPRVCVMEDYEYVGQYRDLGVLDRPIVSWRPYLQPINMGILLQTHHHISINCWMLQHTFGGQGTIPVVIRGPGGVGLEAYFQSIPGLRVVACSTPYNAKGLVKAAIRSKNPVVIFEHAMRSNLRERIPDKEYICDLDAAEIVRHGEQVTIFTYSRMRYIVMEAVEALVNKGYDPEVIDIRSLQPLDIITIRESIDKTSTVAITICKSIEKTGRVLIVGEGIGASLESAIRCIEYMDWMVCQQHLVDITCLPSQDVPVVQPPKIVAAVEQLCSSNVV